MPRSERLPLPYGRLIDRAQPVRFEFDGRTHSAFCGDTIASALAAQGRWTISRSFKYHRPRGPVSFAGHEANTLVQVGDEPNVWADLHEVADGDRVAAQNVFGSVDSDRASVLGALGRFLPVGFYYRSFFGKQGNWDRWEPAIRAMAGLGRLPSGAGPFAAREHDKKFIHCDVAVVGGGAAGLAAAARAARDGAKVALFEQGAQVGGWLLYGRLHPDPNQNAQLREQWLQRLALPAGVTVHAGAACTGIFDDNWLSVISNKRLYKVRAARVVLAHGTVEQLPVFGNNDVPGVVLSSGVQRLLHLYGVLPGKRAAVIAASDDSIGVAFDLRDAGCAVEAIVWIGEADPQGVFLDAARDAGIRVIDGLQSLAVRAASGEVESLCGVDGTGAKFRLDCDLVVASAGHVPAWQLAAHAGASVRYETAWENFVVSAPAGAIGIAGALASTSDLTAAEASGRDAGSARQSEQAAGGVGAPQAQPPRLAPWPHFASGKEKAFVDLDEDLQPADLEETIRLGYDDMQLMKRFSTVGMGPSQGRHSALSTLRIAARCSGRDHAAIGLATARPPAGVETLAHLAGRSFDPFRRTPLHGLHLGAGATMMPAGAWVRPAFYGTERATIAAEVRAVRNAAGLFDVGTLGGLDVRGPQAAEFLERLYTGRYAKQGIGGVRYALMTDEAGVIIDDGVAARLTEDHFYVTTTSANSDAIYRKMLWWNMQWRLHVDVTNVTSSLCGMNLSGPASRTILALLTDDVDLERDAFRYMQARQGNVAGAAGVRMIRVGFLGELGYELHVPARAAAHVWASVLAAGKGHGLSPIGVEAQRVLRLEKGHVIVGQDTDGVTTPQEAGMEWAIGADKPFYVGQRALAVRVAQGSQRRLVCWQLDRSAALRVAEGHLVLRDGAIVGHVTSVADSETVGKTIGMAFAHRDDAAPGCTIVIKGAQGALLTAEVCSAPFYDPEGARQKI